MIKSKEAIQRAKDLDWPITKDESSGMYVAEAPGGYKYYFIDEPQPTDQGNCTHLYYIRLHIVIIIVYINTSYTVTSKVVLYLCV